MSQNTQKHDGMVLMRDAHCLKVSSHTQSTISLGEHRWRRRRNDGWKCSFSSMKFSSGAQCRAVVDRAHVELGVVLVGAMQVFVKTLIGNAGIRDGKLHHVELFLSSL